MQLVQVGFQMHNIMFQIIWTLAICMIVVNLIKSGKQWNKDNKSPRLTVAVMVIAKREENIRRKNTLRTRYYATFQVESGDRMELELQGHEYGLIVEGDRGKLTFQGSRFLSFERT